MIIITQNRQSTKFYSERQEQSIAQAIGGKRTLASGASHFIKGDVLKRCKDGTGWLIEAKTKQNVSKTFQIQQDWFVKAEAEAFAMGMTDFAIAFNFGGIQNIDNNYYIINQEQFKRLLGED